MPYPYSRDPSLLFKAPDYGFAPPLNFESILFDGVQPVRYEKQTLIQSISSFKHKDDLLAVIDIDWIQGKLTAYHNIEEALNGIAAFSMEKFRVNCPQETPFDYIREVIALLKRGHSLLHPLCTCAHDLSRKRCQTLGISFMYSEYNRRRQEIPCPLSKRPREFSAKELSDELAIEDILLFKLNNESTEFLYTLNQYCNIRIDGLEIFFGFKDFVFHPLDNREDLIQLLSKNPLTISLSRAQYYPGILDDIQDLVNSGDALWLTKEKNEIMIFYFNPRWNVKPVDTDIAHLWHSIQGKEIQASLLKDECIRTFHPMKKTMKRKTGSKPPKKKRCILNYSKLK
jgi:hypothetical protein